MYDALATTVQVLWLAVVAPLLVVLAAIALLGVVFRGGSFVLSAIGGKRSAGTGSGVVYKLNGRVVKD